MRLLVGALTIAGIGSVALWSASPGEAPAFRGPETVEIPAGSWAWRPSGDWRQGGRELDAPRTTLTSEAPLHIMRHQLSRGEYVLCVEDGACSPAGAVVGVDSADLPRTGISWHDATAYAAWLSAASGATWRLPTDAEWQRAAAERFVDDAVGKAEGSDRWIAGYEREAELRGKADAILRPRGGWGENSLGVADLAGNVWEWTDDCVANVLLDPDGAVVRSEAFCGARIAEGRHRATIIDFVRDARSGGCGAGVPPDYLGVRLVRED